MTLWHSILANNKAERGGAAPVIQQGILNFMGCLLEHNEATQEGGALAIDSGAVLLANQTRLSQNMAPSGASQPW